MFVCKHLSSQGHLYAVGGNDGTSSLDKCESYDPFLNKWSPIASMHKRRAGAGCSVMDGFIYVVGKYLCYILLKMQLILLKPDWYYM